jgi:RNA polymerase sigma-70 factor (ECF subfamily)
MSGSRPTPGANPDHDVVEGLAREHQPALLRYFRRKGFRRPDDEDAVQEVFIRLARREGLASEVDRLDSYLFATAGHVATDLHRRSKARGAGKQDVYEEARHAPADHDDPGEIFEGREALCVVILALKELPERTRVIFILARLEHMRQSEIARRLGVSLNTVEKHLQKAAGYLGERVGRAR